MHFLQIVDDRNTKNVVREKCIESVKRFITKKDKHIIKEIKYNQDIVYMINESDKIRFTFAKEHDDLFYIDTDCFLSALPAEEQINKKKILMGETITDQGNVFDIFLFYVNGNKEFFLKNYEALTKKHNSFSVSPEQLQLLSNNSLPYDSLSYCHYSLTSLEININKQFQMIQNRLIDAEKEINAYRNSIQSMVSTVELYNRLRQDQNK